MARVSRLRIAFLVLALATAGAACSKEDTPTASKAFCRAAKRFETELERQSRSGTIDAERQIAKLEDLVATAPKKIKSDAETFLDALRHVGDDPTIKNDPAIRDASDAVERFANLACGVYQRRGGGI